MKVLKVLRYLALAVVAVPVLLGVFGGLNAGRESARLNGFCTRFPPGTKLERFRASATSESYSVYDQTNLPATETPESRLAARLLKGNESGSAPSTHRVSVIVKTPGIGYYACVVDHDGTSVLGTKFESND